ncbi:MAG: hypothetical protein AAF570_05745, partial [Bacteroidota bacterium]
DESLGAANYPNVSVVEEGVTYLSDLAELNQALIDLKHAQRELEFMQQNLRDVKSSLQDKDEIIALQKDKIAYLLERLKLLEEGD